ncbi:MAG: hypothetical protein IJ060_11050 [Oscillospiraceae bacterium]|nr:hypothetical protein [Oscillospiraceae bacterium]
MKKLFLIICSLFVLLSVGGCGECDHIWKEADCTSARICEKCGKTEGEPLGHNWEDATCTEPKTCSVCGETEGEALGHEWLEATCVDPKKCSVCGATEGKELGHTWVDATCTEPKTCAVCGETRGGTSPHVVADQTLLCTQETECINCGQIIPIQGHIWSDATCTEPKTCWVCGETEGKALGHDWEAATCEHPKTCKVCHETEGELANHKWVAATCTEPKHCEVCGETDGEELGHDFVRDIIIEATFTENGKYRDKCTRCGKTGEYEQIYWLTDEEKIQKIKKTGKRYTYDQIARNPDKYMDTPAIYTGEVIQVLQSGNNLTLRVDITAVPGYTRTFYEDTIMVKYTLPDGAPRILEDDIVTIYCINKGLYTYESVMGADITVPLVEAYSIE